MSSLESKLAQVCKEIADDILHNYHEAGLIDPDEIWTDEDRMNLAAEYLKITERHVRSAREYHDDPAIVLRAVRYLATFAVPPMKTRLDWFREGLHILMIMASPVQAANDDAKLFFSDLRKGLKKAELGKPGDFGPIIESPE